MPDPYVMGTNPLDSIFQRIFDRWTPQQMQGFMNNPAARNFFEQRYGGLLGQDPNGLGVLERLLGWQNQTGYQPTPTAEIPDESGQVPPPPPPPNNQPFNRIIGDPATQAAARAAQQQRFAANQAFTRTPGSPFRTMGGFNPNNTGTSPLGQPPQVPGPNDIASAWKPYGGGIGITDKPIPIGPPPIGGVPGNTLPPIPIGPPGSAIAPPPIGVPQPIPIGPGPRPIGDPNADELNKNLGTQTPPIRPPIPSTNNRGQWPGRF